MWIPGLRLVGIYTFKISRLDSTRSINGRMPLIKYWLQVYASRPKAEQLNHSVSSHCYPSPVGSWLLGTCGGLWRENWPVASTPE